MNTDVTVLTTGRISGAEGVAGDRVEGSEMSTDTSNLVFEDLVIESCFELSFSCRGGGDITGFLATAENDKVLASGDGGGVEGSVGHVGLEDFEGVGLNQL